MSDTEAGFISRVRTALAAAPRWLGAVLLGLCLTINLSIYCVQKTVMLQHQRLAHLSSGLLGSVADKLSQTDRKTAVDVAVSALEQDGSEQLFFSSALWMLSASGFLCFVLGVEVAFVGRGRNRSGIYQPQYPAR